MYPYTVGGEGFCRGERSWGREGRKGARTKRRNVGGTEGKDKEKGT